MVKYLTAALVILCSSAAAHEMTPAYPKLEPSYVSGIYKAEMSLFNKREDVNYYEISVFNDEWKPIPFAATDRILEIEYLGKQKFEVYIRRSDVKKVEYICTESKLFTQNKTASLISSRICSRIKSDMK